MSALLLSALLLATPATFPPQVQHARAWSRAHVHRGNWHCLDRLWDNESGWAVHAKTPRYRSPARAAYGIPQALPGRKMRSAGRDWRTSALTQVRWGLHYIRGRYGTPCHALRHQDRFRWY